MLHKDRTSHSCMCVFILCRLEAKSVWCQSPFNFHGQVRITDPGCQRRDAGWRGKRGKNTVKEKLRRKDKVALDSDSGQAAKVPPCAACAACAACAGRSYGLARPFAPRLAPLRNSPGGVALGRCTGGVAMGRCTRGQNMHRPVHRQHGKSRICLLNYNY